MNPDRIIVPLIALSSLFAVSVGLGTSNVWLGIAAFCGLGAITFLLAGIVYKLDCLTEKDPEEPLERPYSNRTSSR